MRRFISTLLILLVISVPVFAEVVTRSQAEQTASRYFKQKGKASPKLVWSGFEEATKAAPSQAPAFYVFNNDNGGFVIVAGDDIVAPLLGYSDKGQFVTENMPDNVSSWFRQLQSYIELGRSLGITERYASSAADSTETKEVLIKTPNWNQTDPFNLKCPEYGGKRTVAGCVAVAMSEILWAMKYPEKGTGTVPAYSTRSLGIKIPANQVGTYDWDKMPEVLSKKWTDEQKDAVSQLIFDCGTMVNADYGTDGTGAYDSMVIPAFVKYLGMDASAVLEYARWYTVDAWKAKIKASIDQGRPLYYTGDNKDSGHAFVVDGYDSSGLFHINFGWGGTNNAYYRFPDFGKGEYLFAYDQNAIFGLKPNEGGKSKIFMAFDKNDDGNRGLVSHTAIFTEGVEFRVTADGIIYNPCETAFSGYIAIGRFDSQNNFKELVTRSEYIECLAHYGATGASFDCKCTEISDGDKLMLVYSHSEADWEPMYSQKDDKNFAYELVLSFRIEPSVLAQKTSLAYDKAKKLFTLESVSGVKCKVVDTKGAEVSGIVKVDDYSIKVDVSSLEKGSYTFVISVKDTSVSIDIEI